MVLKYSQSETGRYRVDLNQQTLSLWKTLRFKNFAFDLKYVTSNFETNRSVLDFMEQENFARPSPKAIGKVLVSWKMVLF